MKQMFRMVLVAAIAAALSACGTTGKPVKPDASGYLPTGSNGQTARAATLVNDRISKPEYKSLVLVTGGDFIIQQVRDLGYFKEVIDLPELQRRIVEKNLQDKVPSLTDRIGFNNAARYYGPFLWVHFDANKRDGKSFVKLVATDPVTLKDIFVAEHELTVQAYVGYDQTTWFPLFNSMIDWLKSN